MFAWTEQQLMIQGMIRDFVEKEIVPLIDDLEYNGLPPYDILRKLFKTFGMDELAGTRFDKQIEKEEAMARGEETEKPAPKTTNGGAVSAEALDAAAMGMIPIIEISRHCQGLITAMGVSVGLTGGAIMSKGSLAQKKKYGRELLTLEKVGAWAITEPSSGSDAFGAMKSTARRDGEGGYILNGSKTFITNGPFADIIVFICRLDEPGIEPRDRKIVSFILDSGMPGLEQSAAFKKMGIGSSPTGELFLSDVKAGPERLMGESEDGYGRSGAKSTFSLERSGVAAMALGLVQRSLELSLEYAKTRVQFDQPIGNYQLIQLKLAKMEVARLNLENLVFRYIETRAANKDLTLAEASAMKLYAAQAAMEVTTEAVQIFGGAGYMREMRVEQLMRDAKILQIYAGTDEMQIVAIAKDLLGRA
jgi:alkylation response protein AidB-like acyl-CoA dehydrogenase|tara:strand:+ start:178 stop:1434 length:1257 start_codon:yes stop_codon:yes gene_type:complete